MASESTPFPAPTKAYHRSPYPAIDPSRPELSTANKNIVITGGGAGIGSRIARAFAASGAANIALVGRNEASLAATKASIKREFPLTNVFTVTADVTDESSIRTGLDNFASAISNAKIDVLIANAGHLHTPASLAKADPDDWWTSFTVNIRGNFNLLRAFLPHAAPDATVVNVSTAATHLPYFPGHGGYAASKLAAAKVFDYFRAENPGLRVMQFHPGVIDTNMSKKTADSGLSLPYDDVDLASWFAVWIASPEAKFLDGKYVWSNWDVDELKAMATEIQAHPVLSHGLVGWPQIMA